MASGHSATGALACGLVAPVIPSPLSPVAAVGAGIALGMFLALLMDLDTKGKAYYVLRPASWVLKPLLVWISWALYHATRGEKDPEDAGMHRMFTHQPEFAWLCAILAFIFTPSPWAWWTGVITLVGVLSHRWGDACTKAGVPVSLARVIVRCIKGCDRTWIRVGIPRKLRFITGGKRGVKMFGAKNRRLWDEAGERVMTFALVLAVCGLGLAVSVGYYPFWL
jgi:hypothetical protein